jgi:hypothetical protein
MALKRDLVALIFVSSLAVVIFLETDFIPPLTPLKCFMKKSGT